MLTCSGMSSQLRTTITVGCVVLLSTFYWDMRIVNYIYNSSRRSTVQHDRWVLDFQYCFNLFRIYIYVSMHGGLKITFLYTQYFKFILIHLYKWDGGRSVVLSITKKPLDQLERKFTGLTLHTW